MQFLTSLTTDVYQAVPVYILLLTALSLLISTIAPIVLIIFLKIRYKKSGASIMAGLMQYMLSVMLMLAAVVFVVLSFTNLGDKAQIDAVLSIIFPIFTGLFLPLSIYITQYILGNSKVQKTEDLDQKYLGKTSVLAMWGGFTIIGDFSVSQDPKKRWPLYLTMAAFFALANNIATHLLIEISSLYTGITSGRTGSGGTYMAESDYADFYKTITSAPLQPALEVIFHFSVVVLLTILVFKLGSSKRLLPVLPLMLVSAGLEIASHALADHPLAYFFFAMFFGALMLYVAPRLMKLEVPRKKPKLDLDPE